MVLLYILIAVILVSLCSLAGAAFFFKNKRTAPFLFYFVSFAAGVLLATAFLELLPEALRDAPVGTVFGFALAGFVLFFVIESYLHWHHHFHHLHDHVHPMTFLNLFGDAVHNFVDGVIIAGSFLISVPLGVATTIAVIFHEIPQEIGDFAILVKGGLPFDKAVQYNLLSALAAVIGALVGYYALSSFQGLLPHLVAVGAGGFIYIAAVDLVPELLESKAARKGRVLEMLAFLIGIALVVGLIAAGIAA